jgi:hypothetical protein
MLMIDHPELRVVDLGGKTSKVHLKYAAGSTLCGRPSRKGAKVLPAFVSGRPFEEHDPDAPLCRACIRNAVPHIKEVTS